MGDNYTRIAVKGTTFEMFRSEIKPLILKRNPKLSYSKLTDDVALRWVFESYKERIL